MRFALYSALWLLSSTTYGDVRTGEALSPGLPDPFNTAMPLPFAGCQAILYTQCEAQILNGDLIYGFCCWETGTEPYYLYCRQAGTHPWDNYWAPATCAEGVCIVQDDAQNYIVCGYIS